MVSSNLAIILFLVAVGNVNAQGDSALGFDCRRKGAVCVGDDCNLEIGECTCLEGTEGYNCGLTTANKGACSNDPEKACQFESTCLTGDQCYCTSETYGTYCQNHRVEVWCSDTDMFININPDVDSTNPFAGIVFVSAALTAPESARGAERCELKNHALNVATLPDFVKDVNGESPTELAGFYIQIPHNLDGTADGTACGSAIPENVTDAEGELVRTDYMRRVAIEYNSLVMSSLDQMLNVNCSIANTDNLTTYSSFSAVSVAIIDDDYQQVNISDTIEPIVFEIQDSDNRAITNSVSLGDQINLKFTLSATGYTKIKINQCSAVSGAENATPIVFFTDNCPVRDWDELFRGHMTENAEEKSSTLHLSAFRFTGDSDSVTFICNLQLCTEANVADCARNPACAPDSDTPGEATTAAPAATTAAPAATTAAAPTVRRKRSADEEKELRKQITVTTGPQKAATDSQSVEEEDCMLHSEVVVIIVIFAVTLALMLILIVALVIRLLRSRQKVVDTSDVMSADGNSRYSLPRLSVANF